MSLLLQGIDTLSSKMLSSQVVVALLFMSWRSLGPGSLVLIPLGRGFLRASGGVPHTLLVNGLGVTLKSQDPSSSPLKAMGIYPMLEDPSRNSSI